MGSKLKFCEQDCFPTKRILRIMNFQPRDSHASLVFKSNNVLKFEDKILIENLLLISKSINNLSPIFNG